MFQSSIPLTIGGSIISTTLFDTGPGPAGGGPTTPVEIIQENNTWEIEVKFEIHGIGCTALNNVHQWKVSAKLEGWGGDDEKDVLPVFQPIPFPPALSGSVNNEFTVKVNMPPQKAGAYKPVLLIQLFNGTNPMAVAGYAELPLVHVFEA